MQLNIFLKIYLHICAFCLAFALALLLSSALLRENFFLANIALLTLLYVFSCFFLLKSSSNFLFKEGKIYKIFQKKRRNSFFKSLFLVLSVLFSLLSLFLFIGLADFFSKEDFKQQSAYLAIFLLFLIFFSNYLSYYFFEEFKGKISIKKMHFFNLLLIFLLFLALLFRASFLPLIQLLFAAFLITFALLQELKEEKLREFSQENDEEFWRNELMELNEEVKILLEKIKNSCGKNEDYDKVFNLKKRILFFTQENLRKQSSYKILLRQIQDFEQEKEFYEKNFNLKTN